MNTLYSLFLLLAAVTSYTFADVQFTFPTPAAQEIGNTAVYIAWKESGVHPAIPSSGQYNLSLCAGGNEAGSYAEIMLVTEGGYFAAGNNAMDTVPAEVGESIENAYFYSMSSAYPNGTIVNHSDRFSLSGMKGTFPPNVRQGAEGVKGSTGGPYNVYNGDSLSQASTSTMAVTTPSTAQSTAQSTIQSAAQSTAQPTAQFIAQLTAQSITQSRTTSLTSTSSPSPAPGKLSSGLSPSSKLGLGLGVPLGIVTIAFAVVAGYLYGKRGKAKSRAPQVEARFQDSHRPWNAPVSQKRSWHRFWIPQKVNEMEGSERYREELQGSAVHSMGFDAQPWKEELQGSAVGRQKLPLSPYSEELDGSPRSRTG